MSLRPRAPAPCAAAACCASPLSFRGGRLAAVLATGMRRLGPTPAVNTGVVFTIEPELEQCVICTEPMSGAVSNDNPFIVLECQHAFHVRCISSWAEGKMEPLCPYCRAPITEHDIDDIGSVYVDGRKVSTKWPDGRVTFYEGERGAERKVRDEFPDGRKHFYEGEKGAERMVRVERPSGEKYFYEGEKGAERMVRVERPSGEKYFYEGEKGAERMVRVEDPDGEKQFLEGEKGAERIVRIEFPDGEEYLYEGESGAERVVRVERPDGEKYFYEGEKGAERMVRVEFPDGTVHFYEGVKGAERIVRVEEPRAKRMRTRALVGRRGPTL
jgi:hypothetical protein